MNSTVRKEPLHPDSLLVQAIEAIGDENDSPIRQLKTSVLINSHQAKQLVCTSVCNFIEVLKDRRETLCEEIDRLTLQFLQDDNFSRFPPRLNRLKFVADDEHLIEQKLQHFGSIKVGVTNENDLRNYNRKMIGMDMPSHPLNIEAHKTSPESSGSVDSFDIIDESDFETKAEKASETKAPKTFVPCLSGSDALYGGIAMHFSHSSKEAKDEMVVPPVTLIADQLRYLTSSTYNYANDDTSSNRPSKSTNSKKIEDSSCKRASPSSILKEKFKEYSCNTSQEKWLTSSYSN